MERARFLSPTQMQDAALVQANKHSELKAPNQSNWHNPIGRYSQHWTRVHRLNFPRAAGRLFN